ncbi:MAG: serpin family protein, partial [Thermoplasmata archaeon]|nr:serpin family protein [Thermoplasmata archaeon]
GAKEEPVELSWKDDSQATPEGIQALVDANNRFAFDLLNNLTSKDGNLFFSPYSISVLMAMIHEGARGQTSEEMLDVFHWPEDNLTRLSSFARLHNGINEAHEDYQLSTANALWAQETYPFLPEYLNRTERYFDGRATNVDFVDPELREETRKMINEWVEERTNEKIVELIQPGVLNEMTRLVLTNAIYFKGDWLNQFDPEDTEEADFKVDADTNVKVQMMSITESEFNYAETDDLQMVELPYKGEDLSMLLLLPRDEFTDPLDLLIDDIDLQELVDNLSVTDVDIFVPKFEFRTGYDLRSTLMSMGMPTAFGGADFSGMDGSRYLSIAFVVHQAYVKVNEEGTEAAAATAGGMEILSEPPPPPEFRADHPFLFVIRQRDTGNILFMGKVGDPSVKPAA